MQRMDNSKSGKVGMCWHEAAFLRLSYCKKTEEAAEYLKGNRHGSQEQASDIHDRREQHAANVRHERRYKEKEEEKAV